MARWHEQWARLERWYARIEQAHDHGRVDCAAPTSAHFADEYYSYFLTALHMRDWLTHDPDANVAWDDCTAVIYASEELTLAHDIALGVKHLHVARAKIDAHAALVERSTIRATVANSMGPTRQLFVRIHPEPSEDDNPACDFVEFDAFDLVKESHRAWRTFLVDRGLLTRV